MSSAIWIALISAATVCAQCVEVSGDRVRAGDLAGTLSAFASLPPETEIAISPMPGITRKIEAATLSRALGTTVAADVCVKRATRFLTADEITTALRKALQDDEAKLSVLDYSRASIPEGQIDFPRSGLSISSHAPSNAPVIWRGRVQYGNGRSAAVWAKVRISKPARVVVARRTLSSGQVLSTADVEEREIDYYSLTPPPICDSGKLAGFETAREIRAETVIQPWMLRAKRAIKKGDLLRVSVNASGAQLRFEAKAEFEGRVGDRILVRNPLNGRLVTAVIRGEGIAEIDLDRANHVKDPGSSSRVSPHVDERDVYREAQGLSTGSR
jgi:flagella basal body P-ring formation protein FlgA